jgi:septal ring factor EnvC (AmiA/AmiB activator)
MVIIAWQQVQAESAREQLVKVRNELVSKKQRLAQVRIQETATVQKIKKNEAGLQHQAQKIQGAEKQIQRLQTDIGRKQKMTEEVKRVKVERETLQADRAVELYKQIVSKHEITILEMPSAWSSLTLVCSVAAIEQDREVITGHTTKITTLEQQKSDLQAGKKQQERDKATGQREYERLGKDTHQQKAVLASVKKEQERISVEIKEYEAKQQRLKSLLARLNKPSRKEAKRTGNPDAKANYAGQTDRQTPPLPADFEKFKLPVTGGKVIRGYGLYRHPEWGTSTFSSGLTIEAEVGTPICSIADGSVIYSGNLKGYGNLIIINHGLQVFSVYARCSMMKRVGTQIAKGEAIASVGAEEGEKPTLYFELRSRGKAVNPSRWIKG